MAAGFTPRARTRRRRAAGRSTSSATLVLTVLAVGACTFAQTASAETTPYGAVTARPTRADGSASGRDSAREVQEQLGSNHRIVQGRVVTRPKYPWMVAIGFRDGGVLKQYCGGSLVSANTVLTAAHCQVQTGDIVIGGRLLLSATNGTEAVVTDVVPGPYDERTRAHDYALLRLDRAMPGKVIALQRDEAFETAGGNTIVIAGWGKTSSEGPSSTVLLEADITTVAYADCQNIYQVTDAAVTSTMFCGSSGQGDACQGDSGGPAMRKVPRTEDYELVGLVSWGKDCGQVTYPGVYARATSMACWVEQKLAKWDATEAEIARACAAPGTPGT